MAASSRILISSIITGVISVFCLVYGFPFGAALMAFASGSGWAFSVATRDIEKLKGELDEQKTTSTSSGN